MNYLDAVLILVLFLAAWQGYRLGLIKAASGFLGKVASMFLAWQWAAPVAAWLGGSLGLGPVLRHALAGVLPLPAPVAGLQMGKLPADQLAPTVAELPLPDILKARLLATLQDLTAAGGGSPPTLGEAVAGGIANWLLAALAFILLLVGLSLMFRLVGGLLTAVIRHTPLGIVNRVAGLVAALVFTGGLAGLVLNLLLTLLPGEKAMAGLIQGSPLAGAVMAFLPWP